MTPPEHALAQRLAGCRFSPASWAKRFARDMGERAADNALSEKQRAALWKLAVNFRVQLRLSKAEVTMATAQAEKRLDEQAAMAEWWEGCQRPAILLGNTQDHVSERKLRLFAVACCRYVFDLLNDQHSRNAVDVAERYADGQTGEEEAWEASNAVERRASWPAHFQIATIDRAAMWAAHPLTSARSEWLSVLFTNLNVSVPSSTQTDFIRCIVGNPWRPILTASHCPCCLSTNCTHESGDCRCADCGGSDWTGLSLWLSRNDRTVPRMAQRIYQERRWADMPILADALEEAGCQAEDVLAHCRGPGPHGRGCWVVDLLVGRE